MSRCQRPPGWEVRRAGWIGNLLHFKAVSAAPHLWPPVIADCYRCRRPIAAVAASREAGASSERREGERRNSGRRNAHGTRPAGQHVAEALDRSCYVRMHYLSKGRRGAQANNKREARPDRSLRRLCISGAGAGADAVSGSVYATIHATVLASEAY